MSYSCSDFTDDVLAAAVRYGWIKPEDIPDDDPEGQASLVLAALAQFATPIHVVVGIEGGLVCGSSSDRKGVEIILLDYDTEGASKEDGVHEDVPQTDGRAARAFARDECPTLDRRWVRRVFAWFDRVTAPKEPVVPGNKAP